MILNQNDQNLIIESIKDKLTNIEFGRINIVLSISDNYIMYFDIKEEKNERIYIHNRQEIKKENEK